jgi:WD40 repeat protein
VLEGHINAPLYLVLDERENRLYSGSFEGAIKVWDLDTLMCVHTLLDEQINVVND